MSSSVARSELAQQGRRLEYFTIAWNCLEGIIALIAGAFAGSISLIGFGIDSFIEVASGSAVLWRMSVDAEAHKRAQSEHVALRIVGVCFIGLATYVAFEAASGVVRKEAPSHSMPGIVLACASLVTMPLLSRAKRRVGAAMNSTAMKADARQAEFCTYLSAILLIGLLLNTLWGLWWADPIAALVMVPIIGREGIQALRGDPCCD